MLPLGTATLPGTHLPFARNTAYLQRWERENDTVHVKRYLDYIKLPNMRLMRKTSQ